MKNDKTYLAKVIKNGQKNYCSNSSTRASVADKLLNLRYLDGDQWIYFEPSSGAIRSIPLEGSSARVTANYMLPFHESFKARVLSLNPRPRLVPLSRDWSDYVMAISYTKFFKGIISNLEFDDKLQDMVDIMDVAKGVWVRPFWNKNIEVGQYNGEADFDILNDIIAYVDPLAKKESEVRYIMFFDVKDVGYINKKYDKKFKPDDIDTILDGWFMNVFLELRESKESSISNSVKTDINDAVLVTHMFYKDDNGEPRLCIHCKDEVLEDVSIPAFPIYISCYKNAFSKTGRSFLSQLRRIQREINDELTRIKSQGRKVPKMLKDREIELSDQADTFNFDSDEIVEYSPARPNQIPLQWNPPPPLTTDFQVFTNQWSEVGGMFEASRGRVPTSQASARLIDSLVDQDETKMANAKLNLKTGLRRLFKEIKKIIEHNYTDDRVVSVAGRQRSWEVMNFKYFKDKSSFFDMDMEIGSALPATSGSKINAVMGLLNQGAFNDLPNKYKHARDLMDLSVFEIDEIDIDFDKQNYEIEAIINGEKPVAQDWDDHMIHLKTIVDFKKTVDFENMDNEQKQILFLHEGYHKTRVLKMMESQAVAGSPPAPQPQQQPNQQMSNGT